MAAVSIVEHPKNNVGTVWGLINADAPFPTTLTGAPKDWSMSLTVTGGGLALPTTLGLDKQGNVWVADYNGLPQRVHAAGDADELHRLRPGPVG